MFEKLDYVYAVYKEGSFTKAAEKLFISQPSLSAAIKTVESRVGAPLFERSAGGVHLTEIGREYVDSAERIMRLRDEFANKIHDIYGLETGKLTVGGTNYLSSYILPKIITRFSERYPKIEVTLTEANSLTLGEMVENEELDIVIDSFDETFDEYESYPLVNEDILLCVPKDRQINQGLCDYAIDFEALYRGDPGALQVPSVPIAHFREENFILLKQGNDMYYRAVRFFEEAGISPKVSFSVDQLNISYALAQLGMGVSFATDTLVRYGSFEDKITLYKVSREHSDRTLYVAHKKNKYCTAAMAKFIEVAQEVVKKSPAL